ncbi:hypothetical protein [Legionella gresilensis]|uniref:hypothetical protein n=1 Tax=Legionella gresilensis TaxID=91823 RepID=UPI001F5EB3D4|nr:hypothetical protein [Legionella gresilensis]
MKRNVYYKSLLCILLLLLMQSVYAVQRSQLFYRNFWQPYYHGQRLDYCMVGGVNCGLPVANRYCQMMGYARADQQRIAHNVGLTNYISCPKRCKGWRCNGFKTIRCVGYQLHKPPKAYHYRYRRFVYPRYNEYRVAWCYDGVRGCGRRAAYSFCRRMGYLKVSSFSIQKHVAATKAIGNQKLCFGKECCHAFTQITCFR